MTHSDVSDTHSDSGGRTNMTMGLLKIVLFFSLQQLNNKKGVKCFAQGHTIKIIIQSIGFSSTKDRVNAMYDQLGWLNNYHRSHRCSCRELNGHSSIDKCINHKSLGNEMEQATNTADMLLTYNLSYWLGISLAMWHMWLCVFPHSHMLTSSQVEGIARTEYVKSTQHYSSTQDNWLLPFHW